MKILLKILGAGVLLLLLLAGIAYALFEGEHIRPQLEAQLSAALGRPVSIERVELQLAQGRMQAEQIRIADDPAFSDEPFLSAQSLEVKVDWLPLLSKGELRVRAVQLDTPVLRLRQRADGSWNFASLGAAAAAPAVAPAQESTAPPLHIDRLQIEGGQLVLTLDDGRERIYEQLQLSVTAADMLQALPFVFSARSPNGGSLKIEGDFGPWRARDAVSTPWQAHIQFDGLDLPASGFVGVDSEILGRLDFAGEVSASDAVLHSEGRLQAHGLRLLGNGAPVDVPVIVDYSADFDLRTRKGQLQRGLLGLGSGGLALSGSFAEGAQAMRLNMQAKADAVAVDEVQAMLPAFGVRLPEDSQLQGGTLSLDLAIKGALDQLEIRGPVSLANTRLVGFSLGDKISSALTIVGIRVPGETIILSSSSQFLSNNSGLRLDALDTEVEALGNLRGEGRVAADGGLDFRLKVYLQEELLQGAQSGILGSSGAGRVSTQALGHAARNGIGVTVSGDLDLPVIEADKSFIADALVSGLLGSRRDGDGDRQAEKPEESVESLFKDLLRKRK